MSIKIPYQRINGFSKLFLDYLSKDERLIPFVNHFPDIKSFDQQILEKKDHQVDRDILVDVLKRQNSFLSLSDKTKENIDLLTLDTSFTVTTGHQLCLFTGPLYFIYKIISTIKLCEQLTQSYTTNNFIPIFWMASEDHDFQEVNHIHLFGKRIEWDTLHSGQVGKKNLDGIHTVISELRSVLGSHPNASKLFSLFEQAYLHHNNLTDATRFLVNELFGNYGLVIIDPDDKDLKAKFIPQIKKDILERGFFSKIQECTNSLARDYQVQAFVRDTNFFKLSKGSRELIIGDVTSIEIDKYPERFSPNVLLRPLYQEIILPNLAYVGGGAEVSYWMQLKSVFDQESVPFPILVARNSALLINEKQTDRLDKLGFELEDVFLSLDELNKKYILSHANSEISLDDEKNAMNLLYQRLQEKVLDASIQDSISAQLSRQLSFLENIQEKIIRVEKKKSEAAIRQIEKLKHRLFPGQGLQERYDNFTPYYMEYGDNFIKTLKDNFNPLNPNFVILRL